MRRMENRIVLVTGGASGIGRATVELLAREGATVFSLDLAVNQPPFIATGVSPVLLNTSDEAGWARVVDEVISTHGRIDVLVNNAAIPGSQRPLIDETVAEWNHLMSVNQTGVFLGMRAVLPAMVNSRAGSIVNICSAWGNVAAPGAVSYQTSKGAVRQLTKNAAVTYAAYGVRVNSVHPGMVETPATAGQQREESAPLVDRTPMGRMAQPIEIARGIAFLASDESSYMTGAELVIDGGFTAV